MSSTTVWPRCDEKMVSNRMVGTAPTANPPVTKLRVETQLSGNQFEAVVMHVE